MLLVLRERLPVLHVVRQIDFLRCLHTKTRAIASMYRQSHVPFAPRSLAPRDFKLAPRPAFDVTSPHALVRARTGPERRLSLLVHLPHLRVLNREHREPASDRETRAKPPSVSFSTKRLENHPRRHLPQPPTPPAPRARRRPRRRARRNPSRSLRPPNRAIARRARVQPRETIPGTGAISNSNVGPIVRASLTARARVHRRRRARAHVANIFLHAPLVVFIEQRLGERERRHVLRRRAWSNDARAGLAVALSADARKITRASAETHLRYFERHHRYL